MPDPTHYVFLDTETTGLDPACHEVWEIGERPALLQCRTGANDALALHELAAWEQVRDRLRGVQP